MSGFIAMHREAFSHPVLKDAERFRAWFWLVAHAAWKETQHDARGHTITIQRGQICAGREYLAKQWGWSPSTVERFLTRLETEHMIGRKTGQMKTVITICNYEKYQSSPDAGGHMSGQKNGQKPDRNRTAKEEGKQGNNKKETPIPPEGGDAPPVENDDEVPDVPITLEELVEDWNTLASQCGLPVVAKLTDSRKRRAQARIRQYPELAAWKKAFACIRGSPFLQGQNAKGFRADFDFLLQDKSFTRLVEGFYGQA